MSFIKKIIGPDEKLIGVTTAHWIYGAKGLFWLAGLMLLGAGVNIGLRVFFASYFPDVEFNPFLLISGYFFWFCTILGVVLFSLYFLLMITTEIGLTSKRIIFKRGWIFVDVKEVDLEEIKAADIDNGALGRFLNYGYVAVDARFVDNMRLPAVGDPYRFLKAMNEARSILKESGGSMTVILEGEQKPGAVHIKEAYQEGQNQEAERQKKKSDKQRMQAGPRPQPATHNLNDERYQALSDNPARELSGVLQETAENASRVKAQSEKQIEHVQHTDLPPLPPDNKPDNKHAPLVFERDPRQRKEELRKKIKNVFSFKTRHKIP